MRKVVDPRQTTVVDKFELVLTPAAREILLSSWPGVFRHVILELMPVAELGQNFDSKKGRPTKELYSMAGLLLIKEIHNWTLEQTLNAYRFHMDVHYALNLDPVAQDLSLRTLERYEAIFRDEDLAAKVMNDVTAALARHCEIKIEEQRLDSTHVFSNMASFGRTRMMGVTIKRFLTQVMRHDRKAYDALDEALRARYEPSAHRLFGKTGKDEASRRALRQQVAEDMYALIRRFGNDAAHNDRPSFTMLERVFYEQCEVEEERVTVKAKTGGNVVQNPSDPDATYDGHKGPGYQVQIAETCHAENEVQLVTCALPQTAVESDAAACSKVLDDLANRNLLPETLFADAGYGSDDNVTEAERRGVELVSPTKEGAREDGSEGSTDVFATLSIDDFAIEEETETVERCPAGHAPELSVHDVATGKTTTVMPTEACGGCAFAGECPVRRVNGVYRLEHTAKGRRLAGRRREEETEVFRERYRIRGGIESTNSGIKRRMGLARLRVRGKAHVFHAIMLRLAGWNILRAAASSKMRAWVRKEAKIAAFRRIFGLDSVRMAHPRPPVPCFAPAREISRRFVASTALRLAA